MYDRTKISNLYYIPDAGEHSFVVDGVYAYKQVSKNELDQALDYITEGLGTLNGRRFRRWRKKVAKGFRRVGKKIGKKLKVIGKKAVKVIKKALPIVALATSFIPGMGLVSAGLSAGAGLFNRNNEQQTPMQPMTPIQPNVAMPLQYAQMPNITQPNLAPMQPMVMPNVAIQQPTIKHPNINELAKMTELATQVEMYNQMK